MVFSSSNEGLASLARKIFGQADIYAQSMNESYHDTLVAQDVFTRNEEPEIVKDKIKQHCVLSLKRWQVVEQRLEVKKVWVDLDVQHQ